ncbi:PD40 domain-containing protein [Fulvivirga imtechensis]|nr:PD40 domain-containing protein [Fulvivirga imtechensis]
MSNRSLILAFICFGIISNIHAQGLVFDEPVKLGSAINSSAEEIMPLISPDGMHLYFTRAFHKENIGGEFAGMDIWVAERDEKGQWKEATNRLNSLNNRDNNAVIGLRADSKVVYMLNSYSNKRGVAFSKKLNGKWGAPEIIEVPGIAKMDFIGFYMNPTYDVLLISMKGDKSYGNEDLYVSLKNSRGQWQPPVNLGATINTSGFEISPYLSADGKKLYFASDGHGGYGDADIFVAERLYDSWTVWSKPRNLGTPINSSKFDAYFSIANDSTAVLASNRSDDLSDIYVSRIAGQQKDNQKELTKSLIQEARSLLAEIRGEGNKKEYFIEFEYESEEINEEEKTKLSNLVKDLNYQQYAKINLLSFANEKESAALHEKRLHKIVNYLKLSGINESKIHVNESNKNMTQGAATALFDAKYGVLIIVSNN